MSNDDIRAREAQIRANAHETTLRSLKEVLLLSKIADAEGISVDNDDLAVEIEAMAARTGESVRRIRSRVEKEGGADSLANHILEQKVIDRIEAASEIEDVKVEIEPEGRVETLDISAAASDERRQGVRSLRAEQQSPYATKPPYLASLVLPRLRFRGRLREPSFRLVLRIG